MQTEIEKTKKEIEVLQLKLQELERPTPVEQAKMENTINDILKDI
ncbi:hypothetical protein [Flavobacterium tegetincola]|nr:hypothetical protein [Flavobacterium tegetincola]